MATVTREQLQSIEWAVRDANQPVLRTLDAGDTLQ